MTKKQESIRKSWTIEEMLAEEPCGWDGDGYNKARLTELWAGRECLTVLEVCDLDIPPEDKIWLTTCEGVLTVEQREAWLVDRVATRCVRDHALGSVIDPWAQAWLDGTDRTVASATSVDDGSFAAALFAARTAKHAATHNTAYTIDAAAYAAYAATNPHDEASIVTEIAHQVSDLRDVLRAY